MTGSNVYTFQNAVQNYGIKQSTFFCMFHHFRDFTLSSILQGPFSGVKRGFTVYLPL
jgi:hypothetical protein